ADQGIAVHLRWYALVQQPHNASEGRENFGPEGRIVEGGGGNAPHVQMLEQHAVDLPPQFNALSAFCRLLDLAIAGLRAAAVGAPRRLWQRRLRSRHRWHNSARYSEPERELPKLDWSAQRNAQFGTLQILLAYECSVARLVTHAHGRALDREHDVRA